MYEVRVNEQKAISVEFKGSEVWMEGDSSEMKISKLNDHSFQVAHEGGSYTVHVLDVDPGEKTATLRINGKKATVAVTTDLDRLLKRMGLENAANAKVNEIKAPMPGLIHSIATEVGAEVVKGDVLLILEAMKMENVIKSPTEGTVAKIHIEKGQTVEKGQVMISFS